MVTQQQVEKARKEYLELKNEFDELKKPLDPADVRTGLDAHQQAIDAIKKVLFAINRAECEKAGLVEDIPF